MENNKTIYMTYKDAGAVPDKVFDRWKNLNEDYIVDFSSDADCVQFLRTNFNDYVANLFETIPKGMYKADLWRLCKLYTSEGGGVYADIDLVPHFDIDKELYKSVSFYSCLALDGRSIFQAFMASSKKGSPLILHFLVSFLLNNPFNYYLGTTFDMHNCIRYNLGATRPDLLPETRYDLDEVKIRVPIGASSTNTKYVNLHFFPKEEEENCEFRLARTDFGDAFDFSIKNNFLIVKRTDATREGGWGYAWHAVDICIKARESVFLFTEKIEEGSDWRSAYVSFGGKKIMDSRDPDYLNNNKSWRMDS